MKINPAWKSLVPGLSPSEVEALIADIDANGVLVPIIVDERGFILDGMTRYSIDKGKTAKHRTIRGLSETEKELYVIRANLVRRNLSPEQAEECRGRTKARIIKLAEEKPKLSQKELGLIAGVAQRTISDWLKPISDSEGANPYTAKRRHVGQTLDLNAVEEIVERFDEGESQTDIAADFKVTQARISQVVTMVKYSENHKAAVKETEKICDPDIERVEAHMASLRGIAANLQNLNVKKLEDEYIGAIVSQAHAEWMEAVALVSIRHPNLTFEGISDE